METKDFNVFCCLLSDVYRLAFGEDLTKLPHGKAQYLSWLIYEATGASLSYKTLSLYVQAALARAPKNINPTPATLSILASFVFGGGQPVEISKGPFLAWFQYRSRLLMQEQKLAMAG
jgi:hypothetical protein